MKKLNWKQWTAIAIITIIIISLVVLHFIQPIVSYAFTEIMTVLGFVFGIVSGYLLNKNTVIKQ